MRLGIIARAENRGLGVQLVEVARHLHPTKVLGVDLRERSPYENHWDRYDGMNLRMVDLDPHAPYDARGGALPDEDLAWLLDGIDVLYTIETPYSYKLFDMARAAGVRTVLHVNPEFCRYAREPDLPRPDEVWLPTSWKLDEVKEAIDVRQVVAFPVARDVFGFQLRERARTVLHIAGHRAMYDRNGTTGVMQAFGFINGAQALIRSQSPLPHMGRMRMGSRVKVEIGDIPTQRGLYEGADLLVLPRRYGGLSLPMNEALSLGIPVVSLDVDPQCEFLPCTTLIPARGSQKFECQLGTIDAWQFEPLQLVSKIDELVENPEIVAAASLQANEYAQSISWDRMAPEYERCLS